jgi:hypothetical protein
MKYTLTLESTDASELANFLELANGNNWPDASRASGGNSSKTGRNADSWDPTDGSQLASETAEADPWASQASTSTKQAKKQIQSDAAGKLFPASGEYTKNTPNGDRTWTFGVEGAPECDCGYPAAQVSGVSEKTGKDWTAFWCPLGFSTHYKDKCKFSEFA